LTTLMVPFNNIERHHKTRVNSAQHTIQNHEQRPKRKQKTRTFTLKKNFQTHTNESRLNKEKRSMVRLRNPRRPKYRQDH
jgi:hypothetical protein